MFRYQKLCNRNHISNILKAYISTEVKEKWHLFTSVCIERKPVSSECLNELETEFYKYLSQAELERSLLSDHEIRHVKDKKQAVLLQNTDREDVDLDVTAIQTAQDYEDACYEELNKFKFSERKTGAGINNDTKSMKRKLDKHLVLVTEQKVGNSSYFLPPQTMINEGETLKQTAENILLHFCGKDFKAQIYGNAPVGFYKYKYPKHMQEEGILGAKVFIYFARYLNGNMKISTQHKWLDRNEMEREIPNDYYKSLLKFLITEQVQPNLLQKKLTK